MKKSKIISLLSLLALVSIGIQTTFAQVADINDKIREEAMKNSQIMKTLHYFTDLHGPRLTGSPNHVASANWAVKQMKDWGFDDAKLEAWDFGHPGWVNERASGFITAPTKDSLVFEVLAWTPGTKGIAVGKAFNLILPDRPTQAELDAYFASIKTKVRGKMVLIGKPAVIAVNFNPPNKRVPDEEIRRRVTPNSTPQNPFTPPTPPAPRPGQLNGQQIGEQLDKFLLSNGVLVRVNDAGREHGQIRAFNNRTFDVTKTVPTVVMRNEDFGRIARLLGNGTDVSLEFNIRNKSFPEGKTSYNTIGEIWGSDKKDEVIMLGGHLDSWHAATGATDNAIGCAIMMEAARILKTLGVKPRRTIRVALWSGEEQGLLGSQAYVKKHFGTAENPTPAHAKFGGYFNIDSGTGRARAFSVFGSAETAEVLREFTKPFEEYGLFGAINTRSRGLGGSDHTSFNQAGLPGIGVNQDPIEYGSHTWHTNLDTYERIVEDDVKKSAIVVASAVYQLAMRDELLPRFKSGEMPPAPQER
jgi:carboxypeptidase Q